MFSTLLRLGCLSEVPFLGRGVGEKAKMAWFELPLYQGLRRVGDRGVGTRKDSSNT